MYKKLQKNLQKNYKKKKKNEKVASGRIVDLWVLFTQILDLHASRSLTNMDSSNLPSLKVPCNDSDDDHSSPSIFINSLLALPRSREGTVRSEQSWCDGGICK